jgi:hypothetical protein
VSKFIEETFVPVKIHVKEQPENFKRFGAPWTPTQILMDPDGVERFRLEGFLPVNDFLAQLELGLGKWAFQTARYDDAQKWFRHVYEAYPETSAAAEAGYWAGVSAYKATNKAEYLKETGKILQQSHPQSEWAKKASVWL